jgi:hypothetical protein
MREQKSGQLAPPPPRDGAEQPLYPIGLCQPVSYFLTKLFEAERLLDIADTFLVELGYVPGMPGHQYARYFQRRRVLRHLRAEAVRQADIDQNEVDLERREQQYRRRFFALNVTWNPSHSNAVRISS